MNLPKRFYELFVLPLLSLWLEIDARNVKKMQDVKPNIRMVVLEGDDGWR